MAIRDAREDWRRFDAGRIPSKESTPQLDRFVAAVQEAAPEDRPLAVLDVGCGTGRQSRRPNEAAYFHYVTCRRA